MNLIMIAVNCVTALILISNGRYVLGGCAVALVFWYALRAATEDYPARRGPRRVDTGGDQRE